jgi:hypothetical protein
MTGKPEVIDMPGEGNRTSGFWADFYFSGNRVY